MTRSNMARGGNMSSTQRIPTIFSECHTACPPTVVPVLTSAELAELQPVGPWPDAAFMGRACRIGWSLQTRDRRSDFKASRLTRGVSICKCIYIYMYLSLLMNFFIYSCLSRPPQPGQPGGGGSSLQSCSSISIPSTAYYGAYRGPVRVQDLSHCDRVAVLLAISWKLASALVTW